MALYVLGEDSVGRYVIHRLLQMVPVLVGTTFLIFAMVHALGDPVNAMFAGRAPDPAVAAQIRHQLWWDRPLWQQYLHYVSGVAHGDLGLTQDGQPVAALLGTALPNTLRLATVAFGVEAAAGVGLGLLSGLRRGGAVDAVLLALTLLVLSVPVFVVGMLAQYLLGVKWQLVAPTVSSGAPWSQLIVPGAVLSGVSVAYVARLTRASVAENLRAGYLRTAVAKGLPRRRIVTHHLLRNSLIPVVTFLGTDLGALMGGTLVIERIFNIQGVGYLLYQGVSQGSSPVVVGLVTVAVLVYLTVNLLVDLLVAALDPRIRYA